MQLFMIKCCILNLLYSNIYIFICTYIYIYLKKAIKLVSRCDDIIVISLSWVINKIISNVVKQ